MPKVPVDALPYPEFPWPPTEDELPYSDGMPMESLRHVLQMYLLMDPLMLAWKDRDVFIGGNMFVYFSPDQVLTEDFRGPDMFVVLDVPKRDRKSWVVWQEGKGPDVVIELLSDSTAQRDRTEKKQVYQDRLRVPEYFWYDPYGDEFAGFLLRDGVYVPIEADEHRRLASERLDLMLVRWSGDFQGTEATWLRWATADGVLLPTPGEVAAVERQTAERERQRAEELAARLARYEQHFGALPE
jgi:Uma2 family endonuclease